jgi:hypothetical protein
MALEEDKQSRLQKISKILNYIGGTLIFFGICYWLSYNWYFLTAVGRIIFTLGMACWVLSMAVSLTKQTNHPTSSGALFMLGGLLLPVGISVTLNALGLDGNLDIVKIIVPAICFITFLVLELRYQREILLLFCVIFGSSFFLAGIHFLNNNGVWFPIDNIICYEMLVLGIAYLLLGYGISFTNNGLSGLLCFLGDLLILLASFYMAGLFMGSSANELWEVLAPLILLASFLLYVPIKNKALLSLSVVFLIIYITRLTYKFSYLFGSLGWPIILIVLGILLMLTAFILVSIQLWLLKRRAKLNGSTPGPEKIVNVENRLE